MSRRMGLGYVETLIENLKRELTLTGTTLTGKLMKTGAISAAKGLVAADSGTIFTVDADAGAYEISLPTATTAAGAAQLAGWHATFVLVDVASTNVDVTIVRGDASNDSLVGNISAETANDGAAGAGLTIGSHVITFAADGGDAVGDMVEVICMTASATECSFVARGHCAT